MPVTKSAIKKQRHDKVLEKKNIVFKKELLDAIKKAEKKKDAKDVKKAISIIDKASKKNIFHKNKASRIKSRLAKIAKLSPSPKNEKKVNKSSNKSPKSAK